MMKESPLRSAALFLGLSAVGVLGYLFLLSALHGKLGSFSSTVPALLFAVAALILNRQFLHFEGRSLAELGFDAPLLRIQRAAIGFLAGCLIVGVWAAVLRIVMSASWRMTPAFEPAAAIGAVTFTVFNNAAEELIYRGYLFLLLARSYGNAAAVTVTSGLFVLLHIQGGVPWRSALAGVLTSALIFAALFVRWQSVSLVLSVHVAMNLMQEAIGLRIAGLTLFVPTYPEQSNESVRYAALAITGLVNVAISVAVFLSSKGRRRFPPARLA
jgi:membrane protease YdiL (CAAX protease family)